MIKTFFFFVFPSCCGFFLLQNYEKQTELIMSQSFSMLINFHSLIEGIPSWTRLLAELDNFFFFFVGFWKCVEFVGW